jgi:DHA1 family multidrug resistance protein-like MFS transporter
MLQILKRREYIIIFIATLVYASAQGLFRSFFPLYAESTYLLGAAFISSLYTIRGVANVVIRPITGLLSDRLSPKYLIMLGLFLTSLSFYVFHITPPLFAIAIAMIISGIGWGMRAVSSTGFISTNISDSEQEMGMALFYNMFDIGIFLGSTTGGVLMSFTGITSLFGDYAVLLLIGAFLLLLIREDRAGHS